MSVLDFDISLAVVMGIDQYGNGITSLRTAVSDASAIALLNALQGTADVSPPAKDGKPAGDENSNLSFLF